MAQIKYTAFYPSRPFWAGSKVDFKVPRVDGWFHDQMVAEVFCLERTDFDIRVSRDGRIMLRVPRLERQSDDSPHLPFEPIEEAVRRWGEYLDYLNAFYLLLDSATIEVDHVAYFNLHEITNRDAFRLTYENGQSTGENIAMESIASVFQRGRLSGNYKSYDAIESDMMIWFRRVVSLPAIACAATKFEIVVNTPSLARTVASFAKSLAEYKVGNYETSIVLAWFIVEAAIGQLWRTHLEGLNRDIGDGRKRINRDRKDYLTGRDYSASIVSNMLELTGVLEHSTFSDIDAVRGVRNKIVHARDYVPTAREAEQAIKVAHALIERLSTLRFGLPMGYSVGGL